MARRCSKRRVLLLLAVLAAVIAFLPTQFGGQAGYVRTWGISMEPMFHAGDLGVIRTAHRYNVGDIVAYRNDLGIIVLHRIIAMDGDRFVFKGDNNNFLDQEHPTSDRLIGRLWFRVPKGGRALAWLQQPISLAALIGAVVGAGGARRAVGSRRRAGAGPASASTRGRGRNGPMATSKARRAHARPTPAKTLRDVAYGATAVLLVCLLLGGLAFRRPAQTVVNRKVDYKHDAALTYTATSTPGAVYADGQVHTGDSVFLRLISSVDVAMTYHLVTEAASTVNGTMALNAKVSDGSGWQQTIALQPAAPFQGNTATAKGVLDITAVKQLLAAVGQQTGLSMGSATITLTPDVHVTGNIGGRPLDDAFNSGIAFRLDKDLLRLEQAPTGQPGDPIMVSSAKSVSVPTQAPAKLSLLGRSISVSFARTVATVLGLAALLTAAVAGFLLRRRLSHAAGRIELRYGSNILTVLHAEQNALGTTIELASMEDLARIAQENGRPILQQRTDGDSTYVGPQCLPLYSPRPLVGQSLGSRGAVAAPALSLPVHGRVAASRGGRCVDDPYFEAYDRVRHRISALVAAPGANADAAVPACPSWTVGDVVAHLVGLAEDVVALNTARYAEQDWTAEHVARRHGAEMASMLEAWQACMPQLRSAELPPIGRAFKTVGRLIFIDAAVHEHDLRGALERPDPDDDVVEIGLRSSIDLLGRVLRRAQDEGSVPALHVTATGLDSWELGGGGDAVRVAGAPFELWRGLTGRRTVGQVADLEWSADPSPFMPYWPFGPLDFAMQALSY